MNGEIWWISTSDHYHPIFVVHFSHFSGFEIRSIPNLTGPGQCCCSRRSWPKPKLCWRARCTDRHCTGFWVGIFPVFLRHLWNLGVCKPPISRKNWVLLIISTSFLHHFSVEVLRLGQFGAFFFSCEADKDSELMQDMGQQLLLTGKFHGWEVLETSQWWSLKLGYMTIYDDLWRKNVPRCINIYIYVSSIIVVPYMKLKNQNRIPGWIFMWLIRIPIGFGIDGPPQKLSRYPNATRIIPEGGWGILFAITMTTMTMNFKSTTKRDAVGILSCFIMFYIFWF